ncbi:MAG: RNA polymerase sigma factor [bacterium]
MNVKTTIYQVLFQQYKNRIYSYSLLMLKNRMDAEDVTQDVLIKIWNNLNSFKIAAAKTWIMKTTHNQCIDYLRKRSKESQRDLSFDEELFTATENEIYLLNPMYKTHVIMMADKVKEAIQKLPENLRSIFILFELHGMKYKEISKSLDIPMNSVKVYLLRARKRLQEELKNYKSQEVL